MHIYHKSRYRARKKYYEKEENKEKKRIYMREYDRKKVDKTREVNENDLMYKPLPKELRLGFSKIHDIGIFAKESISKGTNFGMSHLQISKTIIRTALGGFINHSDTPNCEKVKLYFTNEDKEPTYNFTKWNLVTIKDIKEEEELTLKYTFYKLNDFINSEMSERFINNAQR